MVMWVCEAWQVNIWTVFAVRPNGPNKKNNKKNNFASSRSDHLGSDNQNDHPRHCALDSYNPFLRCHTHEAASDEGKDSQANSKFYMYFGLYNYTRHQKS